MRARTREHTRDDRRAHTRDSEARRATGAHFMPSAPLFAPPSANEPPCVVVDNGSGSIKIGFAGTEAPQHVLPTHGLEETGDRRPMERGAVCDWDAMEAYWDHAFSNMLNIATEKVNVLITANMFDTKDNRERMIHTLFETFACPNVYIVAPPVLELYAAGRENGVVVGSGAQCTYAVLVHEGLPDPRTLLRLDVAGEGLSAWAARTLSGKGGAPLDEQTATRAKEQLGAAAPPAGTHGVVPPPAAATFQLPDGKTLTVTPEQRAEIVEPLFTPALLDQPGAGLAQLVHDCIASRDRDGMLQSTTNGQDGTALWYASVVLAGGSTMFPGLRERLRHDLKPLAPAHAAPEVLALPERKHAAWMGGSILGSLAVMQQMWVSKEEYDENGPLIVHRKCF